MTDSSKRLRSWLVKNSGAGRTQVRYHTTPSSERAGRRAFFLPRAGSGGDGPLRSVSGSGEEEGEGKGRRAKESHENDAVKFRA